MSYHFRWDKAVVAVLWLAFSIWTFRRLSSLGPEERAARKFGVNQFGLWLWGSMTVVGVVVGLQANPRIPLWQHAALMAFSMFPICLWGGYFWGKAMSVMFNR